MSEEEIFFSGGNGTEAIPVPIPNTEVKLRSADGTVREAARESRTLPGNSYMGPLFRFMRNRGLFFVIKKSV